MSKNMELTEEEVQIILEHRKEATKYKLKNDDPHEDINFFIDENAIVVYKKIYTSTPAYGVVNLFNITRTDAEPLKRLLEKAFPSEFSE